MASLFSENRRIRKDFSKIATPVEIPNLIELQRKSYDKFLQADTPPSKRENIGLQAVFKSVFPIDDFNKTASLEFEARPVSQSAIESSTVPLQSSSIELPAASNAPGLTSAGSLHSVESQQSPPQVVTPSPSASTSSSAAPLQLLSTPSEQFSAAGTTCPSHAVHSA